MDADDLSAAFQNPLRGRSRARTGRSPSLGSPRAWAYSLLGLDGWLRTLGVAEAVASAHGTLAHRLLSHFEASPEPVLTYANAQLPQALLVAGETLSAQPWVIREGLSYSESPPCC
jgi:hypothetical protein